MLCSTFESIMSLKLRPYDAIEMCACC